MRPVHVLGGRCVEDAGAVVRPVLELSNHELCHVASGAVDGAGGVAATISSFVCVNVPLL